MDPGNGLAHPRTRWAHGAGRVTPSPPPRPAGEDPSSAVFLSGPYLSATGVLQLQILLHQYLVDLIQDDIHAIATHQSQVSVTLRRRGS